MSKCGFLQHLAYMGSRDGRVPFPAIRPITYKVSVMLKELCVGRICPISPMCAKWNIVRKVSIPDSFANELLVLLKE